MKLKIIVLVLSVIAAAACAPSGADQNTAVNALPKLTEFEREIKSLKTADFDYIYVLRRKDGEKMSAEDKRFIKNKAHFATNRFSLSKDEKTVFAGSNFAFEEEGLKELKQRFEFEDFSKPAEQIEREKKEKEQKKANSRANSGANK